MAENFEFDPLDFQPVLSSASVNKKVLTIHVHIVSLTKSYINGQFLISESLVFSEDLHKFAVLNQSVILPSCRSQKGSKIFNVKLSLFIFRLNARVS